MGGLHAGCKSRHTRYLNGAAVQLCLKLWIAARLPIHVTTQRRRGCGQWSGPQHNTCRPLLVSPVMGGLLRVGLQLPVKRLQKRPENAVLVSCAVQEAQVRHVKASSKEILKLCNRLRAVD